MIKSICITLDYELCLGHKTGSVFNTLIFPMNELIKVLDKYNIKITLMVDASYLYMLNKLKDNYSSLQDDYNLITNQLVLLSKSGHSIQLHIHPQWYYSNFDGGKWRLDLKHYKLSDLKASEVDYYFKESKLLLESIINKEIIAFRAGGFSIQSYSDYCNLLVKNGIKIDTSVVPGIYEKTKYQWYDFRNTQLNPYFFSKDITKKDNNGSLLEIPITTVKFNTLKYIYLKKKIELNKHDFFPFTEGTGIAYTNTRFILILNLLKQLFRTKKIVFASIDGFSSSFLSILLKKHESNPENLSFVILGHPKAISYKSIKILDEFLQKTNKVYKFKKIEELYDISQFNI